MFLTISKYVGKCKRVSSHKIPGNPVVVSNQPLVGYVGILIAHRFLEELSVILFQSFIYWYKTFPFSLFLSFKESAGLDSAHNLD